MWCLTPPPPRLKKRTVSEAKNIKQTFPYGELVKVLYMMSLSLTFSQYKFRFSCQKYACNASRAVEK